MTPLFLGIDSGTQSTKVLLVDETGRVLARAQKAHRLIEGLGPGHKEQHAAEWAAAMEHAIGEALSASPGAATAVVAMGISGQQHGFVPIDAAGAPIRAAKLWCDTATAAEAAWLMDQVGGPSAWQAATGNHLAVGFTASKIEWLRRHEPENFALLRTILLPHDWLNFHLTGERRMEFGDASGTGLLDVRSRDWSPSALAALGEAAALLPPLRSSLEPCGNVRSIVAKRLGLSPRVLVSAGGGDNMMSAIGTGNLGGGIVTVSLGTSGTVFTCLPEPLLDPLGEIASFCDATDRWLALLCTMNVTAATEAFRRFLGVDHAAMEEEIRATPPGCDGLLLLPYLEGERTPALPNATGVLFGVSGRTLTRGHLLRAAMEGATLGLGYGWSRLRALGVEATEFRLTGGGSKSSVWRTLCANIFARPVVCTDEAEGAALGAAMQAAHTWYRTSGRPVDWQSLAGSWVKLDQSTRVEPDRALTAQYAELQRRHNALSNQLRPLFGQQRQSGSLG